ncbi:MAG: S1C family serine protease [Eubacterium sp.]|nr:S1C family serine protease [Eubacterium sp.]MCM1215532.1 S1C family serine protease [Lachnospiraceae bacterium]MCM1302846.1 S1C family serine protease [Butyrivibrio sp.]MCM1343053.1 S1C family serine protease [Muribaculaceae bacterium]MCM1239329.1 S1C family serine protease [Lachnospiraceae bacterium]
MSGRESGNQNDFMIEKIKQRPINRKKLIRRTIITASMAVIFGLIACVTFLVLEPVISNWLYPEEEPQVIVFPEDQREMSPEEMLAENLPTESPAPVEEPETEGVTLEREQMRDLLNRLTLDKDSYVELYEGLHRFIYDGSDVNEDGQTSIYQYMVTIRGISSNIDWFNNVQESDSQASGVIIADNGKDLLILVDYTSLKNADNLVLDLEDGYYQIAATLKGLDPSTDLAVVAVDRYSMPVEWMEAGGLAVAPMGSSNSWNLEGTPVIAMGSPMGISDSVGYGMITASGTISTVDRNYKLLLTDIVGSKKASGALFNLKGELIGIIAGSKTSSDTGNVISAYGISELKKVVEKMSNENRLPYMGISGGDVPSSAHARFGVPYGAYVQEIAMDSPAMLAGVQQGDIVTAVNDGIVTNFNDYSNLLMQAEPGQTVTLTVMRQAQEEYKEMNFTIALKERR